MNKHLLRIVALLLVPCLMADPVTAAVLTHDVFLTRPRETTPQTLFTQQAVVPALEPAFRWLTSFDFKGSARRSREASLRSIHTHPREWSIALASLTVVASLIWPEHFRAITGSLGIASAGMIQPALSKEVVQAMLAQAGYSSEVELVQANQKNAIWRTRDGRHVVKIISDHDFGQQRFLNEVRYLREDRPYKAVVETIVPEHKAIIFKNSLVGDAEMMVDRMRRVSTLAELLPMILSAGTVLAQHHAKKFNTFGWLASEGDPRPVHLGELDNPHAARAASYFDFISPTLATRIHRLRQQGLEAAEAYTFQSWLNRWRPKINAEQEYVLNQGDYNVWNIVLTASGAVLTVLDGEWIRSAPAARDVAVSVLRLMDASMGYPFLMQNMNRICQEFIRAYWDEAARLGVNAEHLKTTLPFYMAYDLITGASFHKFEIGDHPQARWLISMARHWMARESVEDSHLFHLEAVRLTHKESQGSDAQPVYVSGIFNGRDGESRWKKEPMIWDSHLEQYGRALGFLPVGEYSYALDGGGGRPLEIDPLALRDGPNFVMAVTEAEEERAVHAALEARLQIIRKSGKRPLLSLDIDDSLLSYNARATDAQLTMLIDYLQAGGEIALNTLTQENFVRERILNQLAQKLSDEGRLHLLEYFHFIARETAGSHEIHQWDGSQHARIGPSADSKGAGLVDLLKHLGDRASLLAAYADQFGILWNDGSLVGHVEIPLLINVGRDVSVPLGSERFINSKRKGPEATASDIRFITQWLRAHPVSPTAAAKGGGGPGNLKKTHEGKDPGEDPSTRRLNGPWVSHADRVETDPFYARARARHATGEKGPDKTSPPPAAQGQKTGSIQAFYRDDHHEAEWKEKEYPALIATLTDFGSIVELGTQNTHVLYDQIRQAGFQGDYVGVDQQTELSKKPGDRLRTYRHDLFDRDSMQALFQDTARPTAVVTSNAMEYLVPKTWSDKAHEHSERLATIAHAIGQFEVDVQIHFGPTGQLPMESICDLMRDQGWDVTRLVSNNGNYTADVAWIFVRSGLPIPPRLSEFLYAVAQSDRWRLITHRARPPLQKSTSRLSDIHTRLAADASASASAVSPREKISSDADPAAPQPDSQGSGTIGTSVDAPQAKPAREFPIKPQDLSMAIWGLKDAPKVVRYFLYSIYDFVKLVIMGIRNADHPGWHWRDRSVPADIWRGAPDRDPDCPIQYTAQDMVDWETLRDYVEFYYDFDVTPDMERALKKFFYQHQSLLESFWSVAPDHRLRAAALLISLELSDRRDHRRSTDQDLFDYLVFYRNAGFLRRVFGGGFRQFQMFSGHRADASLRRRAKYELDNLMRSLTPPSRFGFRLIKGRSTRQSASEPAAPNDSPRGERGGRHWPGGRGLLLGTNGSAQLALDEDEAPAVSGSNPLLGVFRAHELVQDLKKSVRPLPAARHMSNKGPLDPNKPAAAISSAKALEGKPNSARFYILLRQLQVLARDPSTGLNERTVGEIMDRVGTGILKLKGEDLDIIKDDNGKEIVVGSVDRNVADEYGLLHRTANALIRDSECRFLVLRRAPHKSHPSKFSLVGGYVPAGSTYEAGIREEIRQELDLPSDYKLFGLLQLIGDPSQYKSPADEEKDRERRAFYDYEATPADINEFQKSIDRLNKERSKRTPQQWAEFLENQSAETDGMGEVWGYYWLTGEELSRLQQGELELNDVFAGGKEVPFRAVPIPDLLGPLLADPKTSDFILGRPSSNDNPTVAPGKRGTPVEYRTWNQLKEVSPNQLIRRWKVPRDFTQEYSRIFESREDLLNALVNWTQQNREHMTFAFLSAFDFEARSLQGGYHFPDTFQFPRRIDASDFIVIRDISPPPEPPAAPNIEEADKHLSKIEDILKAKSKMNDIVLYLYQLAFLHALQILTPGVRVFNFASGGDHFPGLYGSEMWTFDNRISSYESQDFFRRFYRFAQGKLEFRENAILPSRNDMGPVHHRKQDILNEDHSLLGMDQIRPGDLIFLKFFVEALTSFFKPRAPGPYTPTVTELLKALTLGEREWLKNSIHHFVNSMPDGVFLVIYELPHGLFPKGFARLLTQTGRYVSALRPEHQTRINQINKNKYLQQGYSLSAPSPMLEDLVDVKLHAGGQFSVLTKNTVAPPQNARGFSPQRKPRDRGRSRDIHRRIADWDRPTVDPMMRYGARHMSDGLQDPPPATAPGSRGDPLAIEPDSWPGRLYAYFVKGDFQTMTLEAIAVLGDDLGELEKFLPVLELAGLMAVKITYEELMALPAKEIAEWIANNAAPYKEEEQFLVGLNEEIEAVLNQGPLLGAKMLDWAKQMIAHQIEAALDRHPQVNLKGEEEPVDAAPYRDSMRAAMADRAKPSLGYVLRRLRVRTPGPWIDKAKKAIFQNRFYAHQKTNMESKPGTPLYIQPPGNHPAAEEGFGPFTLRMPHLDTFSERYQPVLDWLQLSTYVSLRAMPPSAILDIGASYGDATRGLARRLLSVNPRLHVYGVEPGEHIGMFKESTDAILPPNLTFIRDDHRLLGPHQPAEPVRIILVMNLLSYYPIAEEPEMLQAMAKRLAEEGILIAGAGDLSSVNGPQEFCVWQKIHEQLVPRELVVNRLAHAPHTFHFDLFGRSLPPALAQNFRQHTEGLDHALDTITAGLDPTVTAVVLMDRSLEVLSARGIVFTRLAHGFVSIPMDQLIAPPAASRLNESQGGGTPAPETPGAQAAPREPTQGFSPQRKPRDRDRSRDIHRRIADWDHSTVDPMLRYGVRHMSDSFKDPPPAAPTRFARPSNLRQMLDHFLNQRLGYSATVEELCAAIGENGIERSIDWFLRGLVNAELLRSLPDTEPPRFGLDTWVETRLETSGFIAALWRLRYLYGRTLWTTSAARDVSRNNDRLRRLFPPSFTDVPVLKKDKGFVFSALVLALLPVSAKLVRWIPYLEGHSAVLAFAALALAVPLVAAGIKISIQSSPWRSRLASAA